MRRLTYIALLLLVLSPMLAHADDWGISAEVGSSRFSGMPNLRFSKTSDTSERLTLDYSFNETLSLEAGYVDLGKASSSTGHVPCEGAECIVDPSGSSFSESVKSHGFVIEPMLRMPFSSIVSLCVRAGLYQGSVDQSNDASGFVNASSISTTRFIFGAGVQFSLNDRWSTRLMWDYYGKLGNGQVTSNTNVDVYSLGITYRFR